MAELLTVPQSFALINTAPDGRRSMDAQRFDLGLGGAVLADLALRGSISLRGDRVTVLDGGLTGDEVLDGVLGSIAATDSPKKAKWWVQRIGKRPLRDAVLGGLVARGLVDEEQRRTLGIFTSTRHPERDGGPEALVRSAVADVLAGRSQPSPYLASLIGLLDATGALRNQFGPVDKVVVRGIVEGEWASPAVRAVLSDIQMAAVMAGVVASTAATSATISSS